MLWETGDRICGKRLRALIPVLIDSMERYGHLQLDAVVRTRLLAISAATIRIDCWARNAKPPDVHGGAAGARAQRLGRACPFEPLPIGAIRRQVTASAIWSNTVGE